MLTKMFVLDNQPFPIIYLLGIEHPNQWVHAVVLKGRRKDGSKTMLKVRNSPKGQTVFGKVQQGEHEIEYNVTQDNNALLNDLRVTCLTFDVKSSLYKSFS